MSQNYVISIFVNKAGTQGTSNDNAAATSAQVYAPSNMAVDMSGNLYFSDDQVVRYVTKSTGIITTIAGSVGSTGYSGDGGLATLAKLNNPAGIAVDSSGNCFIADYGNNLVRYVRQSTTKIISNFAGTFNLVGSFSGDGSSATMANLYGPAAVALDASGNLYIADSMNHVIRVVNSGGIITTFAGTGMTPGSSGDGSFATSAQLHQPCGVAVDFSGMFVYISDSSNNRIRMVTIGTTKNSITNYAGADTAGTTGDNGAATSALLNNPQEITVDSSNNVYFTDTGNFVIRGVSAGSTNIISLVAGTYATNCGGPLTSADYATNFCFKNPRGVAIDAKGTVYISDKDEYVVTSAFSPVPSMQPTVQPSRQPTSRPSIQPSSQPTVQPSRQPSSRPSRHPSQQPTRQPSMQPSMQPTNHPTMQPSKQPTNQPTGSLSSLFRTLLRSTPPLLLQLSLSSPIDPFSYPLAPLFVNWLLLLTSPYKQCFAHTGTCISFPSSNFFLCLPAFVALYTTRNIINIFDATIGEF